MRKILFVLLLLSIIVLGLAASSGFTFGEQIFRRSACDNALPYRLGSVDSRFGLTEDQLIAYLDEAEAIWEKPTGKDLFDYRATAALTVNMVYDRRQSLHNRISQLESQLEAERGSLQERKAEFERLARDFETRLSQFNAEVEAYNSQGGAPPDEYALLIARQEELKAEAESLNKIARELNLAAGEYNTGVGDLNRTIRQFNENLRRKPEEGLFIPEPATIEIYFVVDKEELVHTIAHELGHALGLGHIDSPDAIMFPFSTKTVNLSAADIEAVNWFCREVAIYEVLIDRLMRLRQAAGDKF